MVGPGSLMRQPSRFALRYSPWERPGGSWRARAGLQLGAAQREQRLTAEAAAEKQHARGILALQQDDGLVELALHRVVVAAAARQQAQAHARHRKRRVQVDGTLVAVDGAARVARAFAAQGQRVMCAGAQLIDGEQAFAGVFGERK